MTALLLTFIWRAFSMSLPRPVAGNGAGELAIPAEDLAKMKDPDAVIRLQENTIGQHLLPSFSRPLMNEQNDIIIGASASLGKAIA